MKTGSTISIAILSAAIAFAAGRATVRPPPPPNAAAHSTSLGTPPAGRTSSVVKRLTGATDGDGVMRGAKPGQSHPALQSAMRGALGNPMDSKRLDRWMRMLAEMRPEDAPAIAEMLREEEIAGRAYKNESMVFWQTWAQLDAAAAWDYVQQKAAEWGPSGTETLIKAWAFEDPAAAIAAFRELDDSPLKHAAFAGIAHGLAESDPAAAVRFAAELPANEQTTAAVHIAGSIIAQQGNDAAQAWFDALPEGVPALQTEAARVLMESLSRADAGSVEKFALARLDQPWVAQHDEQQFTVMMIQRNGGEPFSYASKIFEKYPNAENPLGLAIHLSLRNPQHALEWIHANPDDPGIDTMIAGAVKASVHQLGGRSEESDALLARIKDPELRKLAESP